MWILILMHTHCSFSKQIYWLAHVDEEENKNKNVAYGTQTRAPFEDWREKELFNWQEKCQTGRKFTFKWAHYWAFLSSKK